MVGVNVEAARLTPGWFGNSYLTRVMEGLPLINPLVKKSTWRERAGTVSRFRRSALEFSRKHAINSACGPGALSLTGSISRSRVEYLSQLDINLRALHA
jgi:hypothetical protein